jgi:23S rRNA pseudouridine1911/1915/1917 synthase
VKVLRATCQFDTDAPSGHSTGRVDRVVQQLTGLSRAAVRGLFDHQCVHVNGSICADSSALAQSGDIVEIQYEPHRRYKEKPRAWHDPAFEILFEDEHMLVVNKSAHVLTVPTTGRQTNTLVHALRRYLESSPANKASRGKKSTPARLCIVHRLDRGVSGVLVFGKSERIAARLKDQFAAHKPRRTYIAVARGELQARSGTVRSYLATDANLNRYSTPRMEEGELAITHYKSLATVAGATVIEVHLETGRRNQIRVHFAEAGHPILGDPRYPRDSPGSARHPRWKARRLALHALRLELSHPITGMTMCFESPLPEEFSPFWTVAQLPK